MKVLIVDDEPLVRLSLQRALAQRGHEVKVAADGAEGLDCWRAFQPELVYLDVLMPKLSGPELLKVLESEGRRASKVVLMSAFSGEYDFSKAERLGADVFVSKPFGDVFEVVRLGEELIGASER